jgi:hypothetical protein
MSGADQLPNRMHYTERLKLHEVDAATRKLEVDLSGHLKECALQNKQIWHELRSLKSAVWLAVSATIATLAVICGTLLKAHLHL